MNWPMSKPVLIAWLVLAGLMLTMSGTVVHADWQDWWRTPAQQARAALDAGDIDTLESIAPDALWKGVAEYENGEFDAAAQSFDQDAIERLAAGQTQAANQALYNRGVSEVLNEQYENAVQTFNQVLESDPQFADALHNRDIATQLIQQQQQQSQDGEEQASDDPSQQDEQSQSSSGNEQASADGEPGDSSGQQDAQDGDADLEEQDAQNAEADIDADSDADSGADPEEQRRLDEQAARDALAAEAQAAGGLPSEEDGEPESPGSQQVGAEEIEQPLSESEQATEQWLRRIPDDPAGLLRRKLQQSHQLEYPEVSDAQQPW